MTEPVVLSGSSLNTYLRCHRQWEYAYVHRIVRPPRLRMALGISAHYAVEVDLQHKVKTWEDMPRDEVVQTFVDDFERVAADAEAEPGETKGGTKDSGVTAVGTWYDRVAPNVAPVLVEQNGQFMLRSDDVEVPYDWTIDVVDQDRMIRDWKFVSKRPSGTQSYVLNMVGYAIGYRRQSGEMESGVQLDNIVRTKTPYHYPQSSGPVADDDIEAFTEIVTTVYQAIGTGLFPPTGLQSNACSWCGYRDICNAYKER